MFSEKYREDNLKITPDPSVKRYIRSKIAQEENKGKFTFNKNGIIAAALSLCLAMGVIFVSSQSKKINLTNTEPTYLKGNVSYADVGNTLSKIFSDYNYQGFYDGAFSTGTAGPTGDMSLLAGISNGARDDFGTGADVSEDPSENNNSETNNQVAGVDEADIVKTDGRYIYSLKNNNLTVIDPMDGNPRVHSTRQVAHHGESAVSMFVYENIIAVIVTSYNYEGGNTGVRFFCLQDDVSPYETSAVLQNGTYSDARMIDGVLYLLSNHWVYSDGFDQNLPETYVPCVGGTTIQPRDISVIENGNSPSYLVISAIDIKSGKCTANEAILGGAQNVYANKENLYFTFTDNLRAKDGDDEVYSSETTIVKLSLHKEDIETLATGKVNGRPLNQFSMDEYEGNLRIVTTCEVTTYENVTVGSDASIWISGVSDIRTDTENALYVLDEKLITIGKIEKVAPGERVYSVRFMEEVGYFVTFRQVDPLFSVDLSDPQNPTILGELKIPGFSEHLHPYGEDMLFGFGKSATEEGSVTGIKISMFDIENPSAVSENHVTEISADYSEASNNHKAIMVDSDKNIIAFVAADYSGVFRLYVYGYGENGFVSKCEKPLDGKYVYDARFVWIDDIFYLVTQSDVTAFSLSDFTQLSYLEY